MLKKHFQFISAAIALSLGALLANLAHAEVEVAGIKFADTIEIKGNKLQLNGAGIRTKAIFKVYAAGLYLPKQATTAELALAMQGAKSIRVTMLRDIDSQELGNLLVRGIEANTTRDEFFKFAVGFQRIGDIFTSQKRLKTGDNFNIEYIPGTGTVLSVRGVPQGEPYKEPEFFTAMLKIWLGPKPADSTLKQALLGKTAPPPGNPDRY